MASPTHGLFNLLAGPGTGETGVAPDFDNEGARYDHIRNALPPITEVQTEAILMLHRVPPQRGAEYMPAPMPEYGAQDVAA